MDCLTYHFPVSGVETWVFLPPLVAFVVSFFTSWEAFPVAQRWFATGEAISHLRFLEEEGRLVRRETGPRTVYRLPGG